MGPVLLLACLPHIVDVTKYGAFDSQAPIVIASDGSAEPPVALRTYAATKAHLKYHFRLKVSAPGSASVDFAIEEGAGKNWNMIGGGSNSLIVPKDELSPTERQIPSPSPKVPSLTVTCSLQRPTDGASAVEAERAAEKRVVVPGPVLRPIGGPAVRDAD